MLRRTGGNRNSYSLLMKVQKCAASLEEALAVSFKVSYTVACMQIFISSFIYNCPKPEATNISLNRWKDKPLHIYTTTAKSLQSCPTLCDPIDGSPPGFPVPGIL